MPTVEEIIEEAGAAFEAWREANDPHHELPIEEAAVRYCASAFRNYASDVLARHT